MEDDTPLLFGLNIGTTAIKCVLVKVNDGQVAVSLSDVVVPTRLGEEPMKNKIGVHNMDWVLLAMQRAANLLPETARRRVTSVGICGQMHGIVWWCSRAVHEVAERLLSAGENGMFEEIGTSYEFVWSDLITWQDQRCSPSYLDSCRKRLLRLKLWAIFLQCSAGLLLATD